MDLRHLEPLCLKEPRAGGRARPARRAHARQLARPLPRLAVVSCAPARDSRSRAFSRCAEQPPALAECRCWRMFGRPGECGFLWSRQCSFSEFWEPYLPASIAGGRKCSFSVPLDFYFLAFPARGRQYSFSDPWEPHFKAPSARGRQCSFPCQLRVRGASIN